jgi:hypothetical protein
MENQQNAFVFQLEMVKKELDHLNSSIDKIDTITQSIKYWTIGLWSGSILLAIGNIKDTTHFQGHYLSTAIIPLLFWFVDGWYRRIQRGFIFRVIEISKFLNGPDFTTSFDKQILVGFYLFDLRGRMSGNRQDLLKFTSIWKTLFFPSVAIFYLGLILFSIITSFLA